MNDEWVVEIEGRLEKADISHAPRPSIIGNWQCWDDFGTSFIPEAQKWQFVACMSRYFGLNVKSFIEYMQGEVDLAWSYYSGVSEQFRTAENNKCFIEHLLASSCFLLFAMVYLPTFSNIFEYQMVIEDKMDGQTFSNFFDEDPVKYQLYMLTMNFQIPWFVLEAIYTDLSNIGKLLDTPIHKLALPCFPKYLRVPTSKVDFGTVPEGGFKHLLHIFHWSRTHDGKHVVNSNKLIRRFHIPSATELQLSQTVFVNDGGGSVEVSYSHNRMQLTPWHLYQYSTQLYEGLLRFEYHYACRVEYGVSFTAYVTCMACLLKTEADVRVLRTNGIIPSTSFDDKEVLRCVQELKTVIKDGLYMPNELVILEEEVMAHYERSAYRVYGEFKNRYCSNPWIIISVIAGIGLFVLTFLQTFYGMLSYYNP